MLPTHDVHCPSCDQFLYSALSLEDVIDADAATMPHCHSRIAMTAVITAGRRAFRLAG